MKKTLALLCAIALSTVGWADLKYAVYHLAETDEAKRVELLDQAPTNINGDYFGSDMLFVSDGTDYYMGVFEVTRAQAKLLFGASTPSAAEADKAYASGDANDTFAVKADFPNLTPPAVAQWQRYAEGNKCAMANIAGAGDYYYEGISVTLWRPTDAEYKANDHGVYDVFGNVAEYTSDKGEYYGGTIKGPYFNKITTTEPTGSSYLSASSGYDITSYRGVRLVYTPPAAKEYTVSVTINGEEKYTTTALPGAEIDYSASMTVGEGYELMPTPSAVTPEGLALDGMSFTMPESHVTIAYTAKKFATLSVVGGKASKTRVLEGDTVTLTATQPEPPYCFTEWTAADLWGGTATEKVMTVTVPSTIEPGQSVTFTANYDTYPRVLVYGSTVEVKKGSALGNGYYAPESELLLTANDVSGYNFKEWVITGGEIEATTNAKVTVGGYNASTVTYTATYTVAADGPVENPLITTIGEDTTGKQARATFGYVGDTKPTPLTVEGNTFHYYGATMAEGEYAALTLYSLLGQENTVAYSETEIEGKTSKIVMKRTVLDGMQPYYVGIYETTFAHHEYLSKEKDYNALNVLNTKPYNDLLTEDYATILSTLGTRFAAYEITPKLPTKAQIEGIKKARLLVDEDGKVETYTGSGYWNDRYAYGDPRITEAMVYCSQTTGPQAVGEMEVDPYGFYDLWGNYAERLAENPQQLWGGYYGNKIANCNLNNYDYETIKSAGYRPAIEMLPQVNVTIAGIEEPLKVIVGQKIILQPQLLQGKVFTGWLAGATPLVAEADGTYVCEVTEDVTLTPTFEDAILEIEVAYPNATCDGATKALPGQTTYVYLDPTKTFKQLVVTPAIATVGEADNGVVPLTFDNPTTAAAVTIEALYEEAVPTAPGYLFRVR